MGVFSGFAAQSQQSREIQVEQNSSPNDVIAPINGVITTWKVAEGAQVAKGEVIAIMEAMKMEIQVTAHQAGTLQHLAQTGKTLKADEKIAEIIAAS